MDSPILQRKVRKGILWLEWEQMTANAYRPRVERLRAVRAAYWVAMAVVVVVCLVLGREVREVKAWDRFGSVA